MGTDVADPSAFLSPIDNDLVSLAIAAQLVLCYVHSNRYIDPEDSLAAELQRMARNIGTVVPIRRAKNSAPSTSDWDSPSIRPSIWKRGQSAAEIFEPRYNA
jgi:hypothetical protein